MSLRLADLTWELERLAEAVETLARAAGGRLEAGEVPVPSGTADDLERIDPWLQAVGARRGVEVDLAETTWGDVEGFLAGAGPALLRLEIDGEWRFLALLGSSRGRAVVAAPAYGRRRVAIREVAAALRAALEGDEDRRVDEVVAGAEIPARRRARVRRALLAQRLDGRRLTAGWFLRPEPGSDFRVQLRRAGLPRLAGWMLAAHTLQYLLLIGSWWVLGRGVLAGRLEPGWLAAWLGLLLSVVPCVMAESWLLARITTRAGALLRRRLFAGGLRLEPDEVRHQGAGQFLGRVMDAEAFESLVLSGGRTGLVVLVELAIALPILALGAAGLLHAVLLAVWVTATVWLWRRYAAGRGEWTESRLEMTHDLVEQMVGHRTRLAQQSPERWHEGEDQAVERYLELSSRMDRAATWLKTLPPRGWLLTAVLALAPAFVGGSASIARVAVSVGGILLVYRAFAKAVRGLSELAAARIAWGNIEPLFAAAARPRTQAAPEAALAIDGARSQEGRSLLELREVAFRYGERADPVLKGCQLDVAPGDRLLLEGASGSGKSTLAALMTGLREPESGLLLLHGLDRQTLGADGWRGHIAAAPQFHENHVLTETFAFNALMGRGWPPGRGDMEEVEEVCRELGLGELLDRMPGDLLQMVGESGWQLSHGEKSRLFIARALLQKADLVVLDESFAALDPENLRRALECVLRRASTVMVVAHP